MKIVAIIIVVLLILGGGGFAVMKSMKLGPFADVDPNAIEEVEAEPSVFLDVPTLSVNFFQEDQVATIIQIEIKLEILGHENAKYVRSQMPRITDSLLRDLYAYLPRILKGNNTRIDLFILKKRLKMVTDKMFQNEEIYDVLVQSISEG